ncbi:MAG: hypothetical protein N4J56_004014 [Chroococcidiopsis sp. SAG 2025]|uniref:DUF4105 domain-containing protein n=1 Tax=Chroococcidiopsis sp. SAG 2025 TaxID=171389 RepID=UPI0029370346|nr:DUF4105 domain-containing protein [Chroococcidiopsis sp. SAG 2025]MDV2994360.1 hypothetical protein [Chroococcidiopsis sp. SAG 2025]
MLRYFRWKVVTATALSALSFFTSTPPVLAQSGNARPSQPSNNKSCICDPKDPFDPQSRMPKGAFKGQCLSCEQRSVRMLSSREAALYKPASGTMLFANFKHKGKYWVAQIPKNAVEDAIFQIQYFNVLRSPYSAHGQIRFRLKPGREAILIPQSVGDKRQKAIRMRDFIYSANAIWLRSGVWDPVSGLVDFYAVAHEIVGLEDRIQDAVKYPFTDRIEQIRLALTLQQKQQLLFNVIMQGDRDRTNLMYDTLKRNCTTESLRAIDRTTGYQPKSPQEKQEYFLGIPTGPELNEALSNQNLTPETLNQLLTEQIQKLPAVQLPTPPLDAIVRRGLVDPRKMPNLEAEFATEFSSRKR